MSKALKLVESPSSRLPQQIEMDTSCVVSRTGDDESLDFSFMSKSFCMSGLPIRRQFERDPATRKAVAPQREISVFSRHDDQFSFSVQGHTLVQPGGQHVPIGIPYGARSRCLILWMTTQARISNSRWLELGRINEWLTEIGMSAHPETAAAAKEQLIRLSFARFSMSFRETRGDSPKREMFKNLSLVETSVFGEDDIGNFASGNIAKVRFPLGIQLSAQAYDHFTGGDIIPVSTESLREISNNAMAIDIFLFLSFRLPLIPADSTEAVSWKKLAKQFGAQGDTGNRFRHVFEESVKKALHAYRGADVQLNDDGLLMRYSPHPGTRKTLVAVPGTKTIDGTVRLRNRIAPPPGMKTETRKAAPAKAATASPQMTMDFNE